MNKQELYNFVFNDGKEYTDFYFNKRRNKVITYSKQINNNTIALVGCLNITLFSNKESYNGVLITGVCTSPELRGKGIMQELLGKVIEDLNSNENDFILLSPVNDVYYKKYGFESLVKCDKITLNYKKNCEYIVKTAKKVDFNLLYDIYMNIATKFNSYQVINKNIILDIFDEYELADTPIQIIYKNNTPFGWFTIEDKNVTHAIVEDIKILNNIAMLDGYTCYELNKNGHKDLFQIKYLNEKIKQLETNTTYILNKYWLFNINIIDNTINK